MIVIGGGPAGFMGAITASEKGVRSVRLFEATSHTLEKVRISGGGRCNVTNACWNPIDLVNNYPRGRLPLLGCFSRFATGDAVSWFAERGLELVTEEDGRMFPISNSSSEVVSCLRKTATASGVQCIVKSVVNRVEYLSNKNFLVCVKGHKPIETKKVLLATGGSPIGRRLAADLGHTIVKPVPSLFSLTLEASPLPICSGLSLNDVSLKLLTRGKSFHETGRILITHKGISGPAVLRLSAFAARELNQDKYQGKLIINWLSNDYFLTSKLLKECRNLAPRNTLISYRPFKNLPKRFWLLLLKIAKIDPTLRWSEFSSNMERNLLNVLLFNTYNVNGRVPYGEEFVTAGGVSLKEVNLVTMESRLSAGLYFSGELLDIDGVTGGFNFQHCWTSGGLAGNAIAQALNK